MQTITCPQRSSVPRTASMTRVESLGSPAASGDDLSRRVGLFLASAAMPGLRRIRVDVVGDTVILAGRVRTFYERQTAVERSQRVAGVIRVDDQIEVDE